MISSSPPENNIVYFDNAATSFPKPQRVVQGVADFMMLSGGNPGRSGHRLAVEAGEVVFNAREKLAAFFGVKNPMRVIMLFNATDAINAAIQGILWNGGHAVTTSMEHNSVARPLKELEKRNVISLTVVKASNEGIIKPEDIAVAIKPETKLVAVNHGSNVFGVVQPIAEIGAICRQKKVAFLIDASQTAGVVPIDMENNAVDFCAFTGHKGLYGPTGTGGLVISDHFDYTIMRPLRFGGTGSFSDKTFQPEFLPDMFESGTLNVAGIAGLIEGMHFIEECGGLQKIYNHKKTMVRHFYQHAVEKIKNIIFYHDPELSDTGVISFNIEGMEPSLVAQKLSDEYGIMARAGLHCAPLAHETLGTFPGGTVRFSFSIFNTKDEVDFAITALSAIAEG